MSGFFSGIKKWWSMPASAPEVPVPTPAPTPQSVPTPVTPPTQSNFDAAFDYTIGNEGGYSNNPNDSGGPTNWGITIHDLSRWLKYSASAEDVKNMSKALAKEIYLDWYWNIIALDKVNSKGVAMAMFDMGVVRGTGTIAKAVQNIVRVTADAHVGPITLAAINAYDPKKLIDEIEKQAIAAFEDIAARIPKDREFLKGWLARSGRLIGLEKFV